MGENFFKEIKLEESLQKSLKGILFPTILSPNSNIKQYTANHEVSLQNLTKAIQTHKRRLESLLHKSGAILFRGFPVSSASDFNSVVEAFDFPEMPYLGGGALRTNVVGRVYTSNESPPDQRIHFHHEMAYASEFPSKLFFFCEVEPGKGGETALVLSHVIYDNMKERHPEFVAKLEKLGLIYSRSMTEDEDISSPIGRGWTSTFMTKDKTIAQQRAAKLGMNLEWTDQNTVNLKTDAMPAIKFDKERQRNTWFNSLAISYWIPENAKISDPDKFVMFGDGGKLPANVVSDCLKVMDEESVAIPWQKGDILLIDNLAVLHSRLPLICPPRSILASLCR